MIASATADATIDAAETLFARVREAMAARRYPTEIRYRIRIIGHRRGAAAFIRTYESFEQCPTATVVARSISDEESADPYRPRGIAVTFLGIGLSASPADIMGIPKLAPTYTFGLVIPREPASTDVQNAGVGLRTIGTVAASLHDYTVVAAPDETVDGRLCHHLILRPVAHPDRYRVRELWSDPESNEIVRLRTEGNFTGGDTRSGPWLVDFGVVDGHWFIVRETSQSPVDAKGGPFDTLSVEFVDIQADPHELLDFGISGSNRVPELEEPNE